MTRAVFLDRDGVLLPDTGLVTSPEGMVAFPYAGRCLRRLKDAGWLLLCVTNQAVVARGMATEEDIARMHAALDAQLTRDGGAPVDRYYVCPHHPHADVERYRVRCECRKPNPGLLQAAARDFHLTLSECILVGDRSSDIAAGRAAGCAAIQVETGYHDAEPIIGAEGLCGTEPDYRCADLREAVDWILSNRRDSLR